MNPKLLAAMVGDLQRGLGHLASAGGGLLDFVPRISPHYSAPRHLAPLAAKLEQAVHRGGVRVVCHAPPRHGKTELVLHAIAWALAQNPRTEVAYATYGADLSHSKSRRARDLAQAAGVELSGDASAVKEWLTRQGGGLRATGVGGPLTGHGARIAFVDDPYKNRADAESSAYRKRVEQWFDDVLMTRVEPGGSVVVFATRWTPQDLSGRLVSQGWEYLRLPAIEDAGLEAYEAAEAALRKADGHADVGALAGRLAEARAALRLLWPERWPIDEVLAKRHNAYTWASLYQGQPRPRGGTVFRDVYRYDEVPKIRGYRDAMGIDLAYAAKTSSDSSALVHVRRIEDLIYVLEALKLKVDAPTFLQRVGSMQAAAGYPQCGWYTSTTERGAAQLGSAFGARVIPMPARADKFTRAQDYAASWNAGKVLVPSDAPWLDSFLDAHLNFTGIGDEDDDEVDAGVAAHDLVAPGSVFGSPSGAEPAEWRTTGERRFAGAVGERRGRW